MTPQTMLIVLCNDENHHAFIFPCPQDLAGAELESYVKEKTGRDLDDTEWMMLEGDRITIEL